jgi:hypothetical protein
MSDGTCQGAVNRGSGYNPLIACGGDGDLSCIPSQRCLCSEETRGSYDEHLMTPRATADILKAANSEDKRVMILHGSKWGDVYYDGKRVRLIDVEATEKARRAEKRKVRKVISWILGSLGLLLLVAILAVKGVFGRAWRGIKRVGKRLFGGGKKPPPGGKGSGGTGGKGRSGHRKKSSRVGRSNRSLVRTDVEPVLDRLMNSAARVFRPAPTSTPAPVRARAWAPCSGVWRVNPSLGRMGFLRR